MNDRFRFVPVRWCCLGLVGSLLGLNSGAIVFALSPAQLSSAAPSRLPARMAQTGNELSSFETQALQQYLKANNWAAADQETRRLLSPSPDPYGPIASTLSLDLLRAIDQAWLEASEGRFGLSPQAKIWQQAIAQHPDNSEAAVNLFRDRVGWKLTSPRLEFHDTSSDWLNEGELNDSIQAPVGHLPWAGVAEAKILQLIPGSGESCGSCTIDMMYLRNGRFYQYLPELMAQVQRALTSPPLATNRWRSPQQLHRIAVNALYPSGSSVRPLAQAISPDSRLLGVVSATSPSQAGTLSAFSLWNLAQGTRRITLIKPEIGTPHPRAIAFSPDSQRAIAGLSNGNIQVWETAKGKLLLNWKAHSDGIQALAMSPNGQYLVSGSGDRTVKVWEFRSGRLIQTLRLTAGESLASPVQALQISPDGQRLAVATERTIQLWDFLNARLVKVPVELTPPQAQSLKPSLPLAMVFSPNSAHLATLDIDHSIKLWNASNGARWITLRQHPHPIQALAFRPDGKTLISRDSRQSVLFWNLSTYQRDRSISVAHENRVATFQPLSVSPDGGTLAIPLGIGALPDLEDRIELRDISTDNALKSRIVTAQQGQFSPDNRYWVTLGSDVQVWRSSTP